MNRNHLSPVALQGRQVLSVTGPDRKSFLQGLITADISALAPGQAAWSAFLTPQGRIEALFFVFATPDTLFLDCDEAQAEALLKRLSRFRLRAAVDLAPLSLAVLVGAPECPFPPACLSADATSSGLVACAPDPRFNQAGWRALCLPEALPSSLAPESVWQQRRLELGLPETNDIELGRTLALEADLDCLNGVSWTKGCYLGQEVTARTHYRGLLKRRLMPVRLEDKRTDENASFLDEGHRLTRDGTEVGVLRSRSGRYGIALLRREAWGADDLTLENAFSVSSFWPSWMPEDMRTRDKTDEQHASEQHDSASKAKGKIR